MQVQIPYNVCECQPTAKLYDVTGQQKWHSAFGIPINECFSFSAYLRFPLYEFNLHEDLRSGMTKLRLIERYL